MSSPRDSPALGAMHCQIRHYLARKWLLLKTFPNSPGVSTERRPKTVVFTKLDVGTSMSRAAAERLTPPGARPRIMLIPDWSPWLAWLHRSLKHSYSHN